MLNGISNCTTTPSYSILDDRRPPPNGGGTVASRITEVRNLPVELKQKIAFELDSNSYVNLRSTSKEMSEALPSFRSMAIGLKEGCAGSLKKSYETMLYEKSIRELFASETRDSALQALKYAYVCKTDPIKSSTSNSSTSIGTKCHPDISQNPIFHRWSAIILLRCRDVIDKYPNSRYYPISKGNVNQEFPWETGFIIKDNEVNDGCRLHNVFESLNEVFNNKTKNDSLHKIFRHRTPSDMLLVAVIATKLRDYWCDNPPNGKDKNDIIKCTFHFQKLFTAGEIVASCLSNMDLVSPDLQPAVAGSAPP